MEDTRKRARKPQATAAPSPLERHDMVRVAAYFRAERRGFQPGYEWDDWLAAEAEVAALSGAPQVPKAKAPARKPRAG